MSLTVGERNKRENRRHRRKLQPFLLHWTVGKRAKRMPDTTVETTVLRVLPDPLSNN